MSTAERELSLKGRVAASQIQCDDLEQQALKRRVAAEEARVADQRATGRVVRAQKLNAIVTTNARLVMLVLTRVGQLLHNTIGSFLSGFLRISFTALAPYLVLVVLVAIALGVGFGVRAHKKAMKRIAAKPMPWHRRKWLEAKAFFGALGPGASTRRAMSAVGLGGDAGKPLKVPRPTVPGRCDGLIWKEVGAPGQDGLCAKTIAPPTIVWDLDADKMGLNGLPSSVQPIVAGGEGEKLRVEIPYRVQGTFFVPQCREAKFGDGSSAGALLRDDGLGCERVVKDSSHEGPRKRARAANAPDAFVDGPMCRK